MVAQGGDAVSATNPGASIEDEHYLLVTRRHVVM
jgi:hypothetical protein